jgi:hypothetical protein
MRRIFALVLAAAVALSSLSGCYGKFALTRKVYGVNSEVKDKYLRNLVTWAFIIVPVYGVSALVDFILFNTIEFWSGNNPVAAGEKEFHYSADGDDYRVNASKAGETVHYVIAHYRDGSYRDSLAIDWNLHTGNSTALYREFDKSTAFVATQNGKGVAVHQNVTVVTGRRDRQMALSR